MSLKDHLIPHSGNNHHPHVLQHHVLFGYSAILLLLKILAITVGFGLTESQINATAISPSVIINLVNQARANASVSILEPNNQLAQAASAKAQDMLDKQYFAHTSPEGITPWYWIKQSGYVYEHSGENLAVHFQQAENVQSAWMASPGHKKNILNPDFTQTGVGIAKGRFENHDTIFVVQMFGKPQQTNTEPRTLNSELRTATTINPSVPPDEPASTVLNPSTSADERLPTNDLPTSDSPSPNISAPEAHPPLARTSRPLDVSTSKLPTSDSSSVLGQTDIHLQQFNEEEWSAEIPTTIPGTPENIPVLISGTMTDSSGLAIEEPIAWMMQGSSLNAFFAPKTSQQETKLFGLIARQDIQEAIQMFYIFLLIFLFGALTLYIFIKFHIQNIKIITHAISVIGLLIFLILI